MDEQIMGYPTIKMYHDNKSVADFEDDRTVADLHHFAMNNMPRPSHSSQVVHHNSKNFLKKPLFLENQKQFLEKPKLF